MTAKGPTALRRARKARSRQTVYERVCRLVDRRDGLQCRVCGRFVRVGYAEHHHIIPRALGGEHTTANVIRICAQPCHQDITDKRLKVTGNGDRELTIDPDGY